ncbi:MAG: isocitrate/isopropylmalate dehydrogenase family protein [candidate division WS1 bacterium]|jgi:tartrate dehydrogenase|nr:isocitrate/isopropylmalate dehydrogenase family protein [candidate division WS1 bacterium]
MSAHSGAYRIAVIAGDGIGPEVVAEVLRVLEAVAAPAGFEYETRLFPWGCGYYVEHGHTMPADGIETLSHYDAIFLGAVGDPRIAPEEVAGVGPLLAIRFGFDQYANIRPVKPLPGAPYPLARPEPDAIDFTVVREATEGIYVGLGGRFSPDDPAVAEIVAVRQIFAQSNEIAVQTGVYSDAGCRRVIERAFLLAEQRDGRRLVTSATKANAMKHGMSLWNDVFAEVASRHPDVESEWNNVDALAMRLVLKPETLDVVVAPNLFGDILTDLSAALLGGLGFAPSANLGDGHWPPMFEPCHGSAPDIAGRGIANPTASLLTLVMMLEHLGEQRAAQAVDGAVREVIASGAVRTPDMGGSATTEEMGRAVAEAAAAIVGRS